MTRAYYNEFDKKKAASLKALIEDGFLTLGDVDDRPIQEVTAYDLQRYTRCHFFAGIGLWDYALQLAGWPDERPVWTGSCPCQPFSSAGRQKGKKDDRHLWPEWERLIRECRPATCFGEQVDGAIAKGWFDDVYQGLEPEGYAVGSAVLPACGVGAPHRRYRLGFVAQRSSVNADGSPRTVSCEDEQQASERQEERFCEFGNAGSGTLGNGKRIGQQGSGKLERPMRSAEGEKRKTGRAIDDGARNWQDGTEWILCADGKARLVKSGIRLLANGYPARVHLLHAAGDAIVPQVWSEFIGAFLEAEGELAA